MVPRSKVALVGFFLALTWLALGAPDKAFSYKSSVGGREERAERKEKGSKGARALYARVHQAYLAGDFKRVVEEANLYLERDARDRRADEVLHLRALARLSNGETRLAREDLLHLKDFYPKSGRRDQVYLDLGQCYALEGENGQAINIWKQGLLEHPSTPYRVLYLDRLARAHATRGEFSEARRYFEEVTRVNPQSAEALKARKLLQENELYFTVQVGSFSQANNANKLIEELRALGVDPELSTVARGSRTLYRVRVGRFDARTDAERLASRLRRQGYLTKIFP
ncbi:MAG: SPOR domain-containing protein [Candidatus Omnitrophica bacterium]|nr:SPOR domain-containing protein [Candidatus Omnitrophota bacterium]